MSDEEIDQAIAEASGFEYIKVDYESLSPEPGLEKGPDGIFRSPGANKWAKQIEEQCVQCVGDYFVEVKTGRIFAAFHGPDNGENGYRSFDYCSDLNAIHAAIMAQPLEVRASINHCLMESLRPNDAYVLDRTINATARQRAEAFLRVKGLWKEGA